MKNNSPETILTTVLIIIAILILNPWHFWMPDMLTMTMLAATLVLFAVYASFILREKKGDERELSHRTLAGRNAFLIGSGVLVIAICVQGLAHAVDPWLVVTLVSMIVVKIGTRIWSDRNL